MERERIAQTIEHSLLRANATESDIIALCREALEHGFYSVCINPVHVPGARRVLTGRGVRITTVVGFPLGASSSGVKAGEAMQAVLAGADELDMVMDIGAALEGRWEQVCRDIQGVVMASPEAVHKVIIEACYLSDEQKRLAVLAAVESGAGYVKTSTGFGSGGATIEDVRLIADVVKGRARIKAAGGIKTLRQAVDMIEAGADLIGTSSGVAILDEIDGPSGT